MTSTSSWPSSRNASAPLCRRSAAPAISSKSSWTSAACPKRASPTAKSASAPRKPTRDDLQHVIDNIGDFGADNRAGIERTLHRISAIRNRKGAVIGLTCRVGRAVYGVIDIIQDIITSGSSLLLLGRPGVGKTTLLREASRVLSDKKRVVIVDTSNEIAGDGDIPHPSIGRARRMQVATPTLQHEVMIEAVENHMPEAIIIDEIGRELEAVAARTIAERGVQLIGTAHGNTLENLLMNPTLSDLVGGIDTVTLSDEEARRRGTQKTVLERKAPPTFDVLIEIQERQRMIVHHKVAEAVDSLLRGWTLSPEIRYVDSGNHVHIESVEGQERPGRIGRSRQDAENRRRPPPSARQTRRGTPPPSSRKISPTAPSNPTAKANRNPCARMYSPTASARTACAPPPRISKSRSRSSRSCVTPTSS